MDTKEYQVVDFQLFAAQRRHENALRQHDEDPCDFTRMVPADADERLRAAERAVNAQIEAEAKQAAEVS